jgi:V-type H+-transporting ATPase subunit H
VKEKVIRVIVATFRVAYFLILHAASCFLSVSVQNFVTKAPSANLPAMLVVQLLPFIKNLCGRKWSDEDIIEDVQFLRDELNMNFQSLTYVRSVTIMMLTRLLTPTVCRTYDEYSSELTSGHLSWTPVHESDDFWKENAIKLNDHDYLQLKYNLRLSIFVDEGRNILLLYRILVKLLKNSNNAVVLAVAAHDVGQYVKHYERGKKCDLYTYLTILLPDTISLP